MYVIRSPKSGFPDLFAAYMGEGGWSHFVIECKVNREDFLRREREELLRLASEHGFTPVLAFRAKGGRRILLDFIAGDKIVRLKNWVASLRRKELKHQS